jgi:DNA primase
MTGLCPFHDEKTPSFSVSPAKNIYKCFGCGRAGDSVGFMMEHEQFTFVEALRYLAEKYNITIEERKLTPEEVVKMDRSESLFGMLNFANNYYQKALLKSQEGRAIGYSYFQERGILDKTIEEFQLGYAGADEKLADQLRKMGYDDDLLREAGLINKNGFDFFRNRVMFPIHNLSGKAIGLAGRVLGQGGGPKYLNSPESAIYVKNKVLYGMHLAKSHIRKHDKCYLVEGYTDVISLYQNNFQNVVASSGTSLTTNQVGLIKRFCNNVTILYDGDAAGIKAALRGVEMMLQADLNVYIVLFPEGKDPDSFMNEVGHDAFSKFIAENEKDFILFQADLSLRELKSDPIKKAAFVNSMIKTIAFIEDSVKRSAYVQELSLQANMSEDVIINELNKEIKKRLWERRKKSSSPTPPPPDSENPAEPPEIAPQINEFPKERDILRVLMAGGDQVLPKLADITVRDFILEQLKDVPEFLHPLYDKMYQEVLKTADETWTKSLFVNHPDPEIRNLAISLMSEDVEISDNWEKRWGIGLQTQPIPEENYYADSLQATLRLKLERVQLIAQENIAIIKTLEDADEIEKHFLIQGKLIEMKKELANQLRAIVLQ